jgi:hypothetical protein
MMTGPGRSDGDRVLDEESREWLRCLADDGLDGHGRSRIERERCLARLQTALLGLIAEMTPAGAGHRAVSHAVAAGLT